MPTITILLQHSTRSFSQHNEARKRKEKKRYIYLKGKNKAVLICRQQDCLYRQPQGIYKKISPNKTNSQLFPCYHTGLTLMQTSMTAWKEYQQWKEYQHGKIISMEKVSTNQEYQQCRKEKQMTSSYQAVLQSHRLVSDCDDEVRLQWRI